MTQQSFNNANNANIQPRDALANGHDNAVESLTQLQRALAVAYQNSLAFPGMLKQAEQIRAWMDSNVVVIRTFQKGNEQLQEQLEEQKKGKGVANEALARWQDNYYGLKNQLNELQASYKNRGEILDRTIDQLAQEQALRESLEKDLLALRKSSEPPNAPSAGTPEESSAVSELQFESGPTAADGESPSA